MEHEPAIPHPATDRGIDVAGFRVFADPHCSMPVEYKVNERDFCLLTL